MKAAVGDWCPVVWMAETAKRGYAITFREDGSKVEEPVDMQLRTQMAKEAAQYMRPKRKAIEHSGANGGAFEVVVTALESEL